MQTGNQPCIRRYPVTPATTTLLAANPPPRNSARLTPRRPRLSSPPFAHDFLDPTLLPASLPHRLRRPAGRHHHLLHLHHRRLPRHRPRRAQDPQAAVFFGHDLDRPGRQRPALQRRRLSVQLQAGFIALATSTARAPAIRPTSAPPPSPSPTSSRSPPPPGTTSPPISRDSRAFAGADGQFDASRYAAFRDNLKTNPRLSEGDISRVLSDDVRVPRVQQLLAGPGYVLPGEIRDSSSAPTPSGPSPSPPPITPPSNPRFPWPRTRSNASSTTTPSATTCPPRVGGRLCRVSRRRLPGRGQRHRRRRARLLRRESLRFPAPGEKAGRRQEAGASRTPPSRPIPTPTSPRCGPQVEQALKTERASISPPRPPPTSPWPSMSRG